MNINIEYKDVKFIICQEMVHTKDVNMQEYKESLDKLTRMRYINGILKRI